MLTKLNVTILLLLLLCFPSFAQVERSVKKVDEQRIEVTKTSTVTEVEVLDIDELYGKKENLEIYKKKWLDKYDADMADIEKKIKEAEDAGAKKSAE